MNSSGKKRTLMYSEKNSSLAKENARLRCEVSKFQRLSTKLWLQHVKDRLDTRRVWKNGWKQGYRIRAMECQTTMPTSPLTPKMKLDKRLEDKFKILVSSSISQHQRSIRDIVAELNPLNND